MTTRSLRCTLGVMLALSCFFGSPALFAKARELAVSEIEAIRIMGPNSLPQKILVILSRSADNLKFVTNLVNVVARIHEIDRIPPGKSFKVRVYPSDDDILKDLQKNVGAKIMKEFVEAGGIYLDGDIWMQDWGELAQVRLKKETQNHLLILDSNRQMGSQGLAKFFADRWDACYLKNPSPRPTGGDFGGNIEVTPDDVLVIGNTASPEFLKLLAQCGYKDRMAVVETDWLVVGHCDEYLSFAPNPKTTEGFSLIKGDPALALKLIKLADRKELEAISRKDYRTQILAVHDYLNAPGKTWQKYVQEFLDHYEPYTGRAEGETGKRQEFAKICRAGEDGVSTEAARFVRQNLALTTIINSNVDVIAQKCNQVNRMGSQVRSIAAFPVLFFPKNGRFLAWLPGVINQLILGRHLLIPDPKVKLFRDYLRQTTEKLGLVPHFLDATPYHERWGEIHCGTNVLRDPKNFVVRPKHLPDLWK